MERFDDGREYVSIGRSRSSLSQISIRNSAHLACRYLRLLLWNKLKCMRFQQSSRAADMPLEVIFSLACKTLCEAGSRRALFRHFWSTCLSGSETSSFSAVPQGDFMTSFPQL
jgi:hypothetical protein